MVAPTFTMSLLDASVLCTIGWELDAVQKFVEDSGDQWCALLLSFFDSWLREPKLLCHRTTLDLTCRECQRQSVRRGSFATSDALKEHIVDIHSDLIPSPSAAISDTSQSNQRAARKGLIALVIGAPTVVSAPAPAAGGATRRSAPPSLRPKNLDAAYFAKGGYDAASVCAFAAAHSPWRWALFVHFFLQSK